MRCADLLRPPRAGCGGRCDNRLVLTGLIVFFVSAPLQAEPVRVTGRSAWSRWSATTRAFGSALSKAEQDAEGNRDRSSFNDQIGYGITRRLWAAGSFDYNLLELTDPARPGVRTAELAQLSLAGSALFYPWPQARIRPFIGAGLGVGRSDVRSVPSWRWQNEKDEVAGILQTEPAGSAVTLRQTSRGEVEDYLLRTWTVGTEFGLSRRLALNLAFRQVLFPLRGSIVKEWRGSVRRADGRVFEISPEANSANRTSDPISEDVIQSQVGLGVTYRF